MKLSLKFWMLSALVASASWGAHAQPGHRPRRGNGDFGRSQRPMQATGNAPAPVAFQTLKGEAYFLERIALPPNAQLHVSLVGKVAGADYLPLGTTVLDAKSGVTPFQIYLPLHLPPAPYRLQAWIVANNRVVMIGHDAQTLVDSIDVTTKIRLKPAPAPQTNAKKPTSAIIVEGVPTFTVNGEVLKLDRRALAPDAVVEVTFSDVSRADAPEKVLNGFKREMKGYQLPLPFEFGIAKNELLPNHRYNLRARITEDGNLTYITDTAHWVTPENIGKKWELLVKPAR